MLGRVKKAEITECLQIVHGQGANICNAFAAYRNRKRLLFKALSVADVAVGGAHIPFNVPFDAFRGSLRVSAL